MTPLLDQLMPCPDEVSLLLSSLWLSNQMVLHDLQTPLFPVLSLNHVFQTGFTTTYPSLRSFRINSNLVHSKIISHELTCKLNELWNQQGCQMMSNIKQAYPHTELSFIKEENKNRNLMKLRQTPNFNPELIFQCSIINTCKISFIMETQAHMAPM